jgi:hypothetical protein
VSAPLPHGDITCCGYTCHYGAITQWECPGCHTVHVLVQEPPPDPK